MREVSEQGVTDQSPCNSSKQHFRSSEGGSTQVCQILRISKQNLTTRVPEYPEQRGFEPLFWNTGGLQHICSSGVPAHAASTHLQMSGLPAVVAFKGQLPAELLERSQIFCNGLSCQTPFLSELNVINNSFVYC